MKNMEWERIAKKYIDTVVLPFFVNGFVLEPPLGFATAWGDLLPEDKRKIIKEFVRLELIRRDSPLSRVRDTHARPFIDEVRGGLNKRRNKNLTETAFYRNLIVGSPVQ